MVEDSKGSGRITRWKAWESLHGKTVESMKVNIEMIKKKERESSTGLMAENMRVNGLMGSNMVSEFIPKQAVDQDKVSGKMEKELLGFEMKVSHLKLTEFDIAYILISLIRISKLTP